MRIAALALASAAALALAGCAPTPHVTRTPTPSATAVFASDAAALAAAKKAYEAYLATSDEVAADGGANVGRLSPYVTSSRLKIESEGAGLLAAHGVHTSGRTKFSHSKLEEVGHTGTETTVTFYTCWDVSQVRVLDAQGKDVTPADRKDVLTLEVSMTTRNGRLPLKLAKDEPWSGTSVCS